MQSGLNNTRFENTLHENFAEYPKMRRPRPATLAKILAHQKTTENVSKNVETNTKGRDNLEVPLRQEFLNKKKQIEKVAASLVKQFELQKVNGNMLLQNISSQDSADAQPLTMHTEFDLQLTEPDKKTVVRSLKDAEQHLVNVLYTKVKAHPNGLFAESVPHWYKQTFDKDLNLDWLELLQASNKFEIEEVQNKIVLYTKETTEHLSMFKANECDSQTKSPVGIVRYKHLQISQQEYAKKAQNQEN